MSTISVQPHHIDPRSYYRRIARAIDLSPDSALMPLSGLVSRGLVRTRAGYVGETDDEDGVGYELTELGRTVLDVIHALPADGA